MEDCYKVSLEPPVPQAAEAQLSQPGKIDIVFREVPPSAVLEPAYVA